MVLGACIHIIIFLCAFCLVYYTDCYNIVGASCSEKVSMCVLAFPNSDLWLLPTPLVVQVEQLAWSVCVCTDNFLNEMTFDLDIGSAVAP